MIVQIAYEVRLPLPDRITLDVLLTDQGGPPTGCIATVMSLDWLPQAVFTANSRIQKYPSGVLQGDYYLIGRKYAEPEAISARLVSFTGEDQSLYMDIDEGQRPQGGDGFLSGSFPLSMFTQEGNLPSQADIRILYRPEQGAGGDGYVVATTTCSADGSWQVSGLNENSAFDVVARIPGFNDVIISNVIPIVAEQLRLFGGFSFDTNKLEGSLTVVGGYPPYAITVIGKAPEGIQFEYAYGAVTASGTITKWENFNFWVRVTDSKGIWAESHVELPEGYMQGGEIQDIEVDGLSYRVHKFTTNDIAIVSGLLPDLQILVVGGGGAGARGNTGGGGGGGGVLYIESATLEPGEYEVVVGEGGNNNPVTNATERNGGNSSIGNYIALGGGGGSAGGSTPVNEILITAGLDGGSGGGGGGSWSNGSSTNAGGQGTEGQGHKGGNGNHTPYTHDRASGGGGGAGEAGGNASSGVGGKGGDGIEISITGEAIYYGGGGGGGTNGGTFGIGGLGGGGNGIGRGGAAASGTDGLGGGGGGTGEGASNSGRGGRGVVICRYRIL